VGTSTSWMERRREREREREDPRSERRSEKAGECARERLGYVSRRNPRPLFRPRVPLRVRPPEMNMQEPGGEYLRPRHLRAHEARRSESRSRPRKQTGGPSAPLPFRPRDDKQQARISRAEIERDSDRVGGSCKRQGETQRSNFSSRDAAHAALSE